MMQNQLLTDITGVIQWKVNLLNQLALCSSEGPRVSGTGGGFRLSGLILVMKDRFFSGSSALEYSVAVVAEVIARSKSGLDGDFSS